MGFTRTRANTVLDDLFPNSASKGYTYIGLSTTVPNENGGNVTEPSSDAGYKRTQVTVMGPATNGQISNREIIFLGETTGDGWGTLVAFTLNSTQSGGTPYFSGELNSALQAPAGYIPIFRAGALVIGLDKNVLD